MELGWRSQTMQANRMMNAPWKVARADVRGGGPDVWGFLSQSAVNFEIGNLLAEAGRTFLFVPYAGSSICARPEGSGIPTPASAVMIRRLF